MSCEAAHKLRLTTSATMMFGTVETIEEERMEHLARIREVQDERPAKSRRFWHSYHGLSG